MVYLRMLRRRHLAILWVSQVLSAMGDFLYSIAVIWIAVQVAGAGAALVAAAGPLAGLVFGLLGGVYADRWNRRTTMIVVDLLRALAVLALPVLAHLGTLHLWQLVVVAVVVNSLGAFFEPALIASLPALTGDGQTLQATNGLMDATRRLARALGPSMAGVLVALIPLTHFFTLDAVSFGISAFAVFSLGRRFAWQPERNQQVSSGLRGIGEEILGAMRLVRGYRPLFWALAGLAVVSFAWGIAFTVGVPLLTARVLKSNVGAYGLIVGAYGVGNILSNIVIGSLTIRRRILTYFSGKIVLGIGFFLIACAQTLPLALFGAALAAVGGPMGDIMLLLIMQTELPAGQIGKVYSLLETLESAGAALGLLFAGLLYSVLSVPLVIALSATVMAAVGIAGLLRFGVAEPVVVAPTVEPVQSGA